jgi:hypothetical protein
MALSVVEASSASQIFLLYIVSALQHLAFDMSALKMRSGPRDGTQRPISGGYDVCIMDGAASGAWRGNCRWMKR